MFDLAWSEIALIGVVALIAIGPKDMPVAIKAVAEMVKKARRMASEFQTHVDEMVREANLHEVRDQINDLRSLDIKGKILGAVDGDGSIRRTMNDRPFSASSPTVPPPPVTPVVNEVPSGTPEATIENRAITAPDPAPAVIPPAYTDPRAVPPAQHEAAQHESATHSAPHA